MSISLPFSLSDWPQLLWQESVQTHRLDCKIDRTLAPQTYVAFCERETIHVIGSDSKALCYAIPRLITGLKSGHLGEVLGEQKPFFALRTFWPNSEKMLCFEKGLQLCFPQWLFKEEEAQSEMMDLLQLGYNCVVIGQKPWLVAPDSYCEYECEQLIPLLERLAPVDVILAPQWKTLLPIEEKVQSIGQMGPLLSACRFLYVRGSPYAEGDLTHYETTQKELQAFERVIDGRCRLIYGVQTSCYGSHWIQDLCDDASEGTIISFSACDVSGKVWHPLWEELREAIDISATPLLPLCNPYEHPYQSGLWTFTSSSQVQKMVAKMERHHFAGAIVCCAKIESALDCHLASLWAQSQLLWDRRDLDLSFATWFKAHYPSWPLPITLAVIEKAKRVADQLKRCEDFASGVKTESIRIDLHHLLGLLAELQAEAKSHADSLFQEMVTTFVKESKSLAQKIATHHHFSLPI